MNKIPNWVWISVFLAALIAIKFIFIDKSKKQAGSPQGSKTNAGIAVNYYVARQSDFVNQVFAAGKLGAINAVELHAEISARITSILFTEGERVNAGAVLVKLNDADLQAQLLKVKNQLNLAGQKLYRLKKLIEIKGVSQEEVEMQENEIALLKADEAFINAQLAKTVITAPFAGVVGLKNISEGAYVTNTTPIVNLVQTSPLYVEFSLPERYSDLIKNGSEIIFSAENTVSALTLSATIYAIDPQVEETTRSIRARALYQGENKLYPGAFVKVYVNLGSRNKTIMVPTQCLVPVLKGQKLWLCRNGRATEAMVKTGVRTDSKIEIIEGLQAGDTILTTGLLAVKKDMQLKLLKATQ